MAVHAANSIGYYLSLPAERKEFLGSIRHWENLKIGFEGETVWVKNLTPAQLTSLEVKTIPSKDLYYASGNQLFLQGSLLPSRSIPSLLWTPISRGLTIELPSLNHNYFGLHDPITIRLHRTEEEKEGKGLWVSMKALKAYVETAPAVRLKNISWVIVDEQQAFLLGTPLLPLKGEVSWQAKDFFLPAGFGFELPLLLDTLHQVINPQEEDWIIWKQDGTYFRLGKDAFRPLSIASLRKSINDRSC